MSRKKTINEALLYLRNAFEPEAELRAREFIADLKDSPEDVQTAFISHLIAIRQVQSMERKEDLSKYSRAGAHGEKN